MSASNVYLVMAVDSRGDDAKQHVHAVFFSNVSAESDARRYIEMHQAVGSDAWAYVSQMEVRP